MVLRRKMKWAPVIVLLLSSSNLCDQSEAFRVPDSTFCSPPRYQHSTTPPRCLHVPRGETSLHMMGALRNWFLGFGTNVAKVAPSMPTGGGDNPSAHHSLLETSSLIAVLPDVIDLPSQTGVQPTIETMDKAADAVEAVAERAEMLSDMSKDLSLQTQTMKQIIDLGPRTPGGTQTLFDYMKEALLSSKEGISSGIPNFKGLDFESFKDVQGLNMDAFTKWFATINDETIPKMAESIHDFFAVLQTQNWTAEQAIKSLRLEEFGGWYATAVIMITITIIRSESQVEEAREQRNVIAIASEKQKLEQQVSELSDATVALSKELKELKVDVQALRDDLEAQKVLENELRKLLSETEQKLETETAKRKEATKEKNKIEKQLKKQMEEMQGKNKIEVELRKEIDVLKEKSKIEEVLKKQISELESQLKEQEGTKSAVMATKGPKEPIKVTDEDIIQKEIKDSLEKEKTATEKAIKATKALETEDTKEEPKKDLVQEVLDVNAELKKATPAKPKRTRAPKGASSAPPQPEEVVGTFFSQVEEPTDEIPTASAATDLKKSSKKSTKKSKSKSKASKVAKVVAEKDETSKAAKVVAEKGNTEAPQKMSEPKEDTYVVIDWSGLAPTTLKKKTVKELTEYLEAKGATTTNEDGKVLKKAELVETIKSL